MFVKIRAALIVRCRVKFLLDALTAIKNNNVHKLLDVDQQQQLMRMQKLLKTYTRGHTDVPLYTIFGFCSSSLKYTNHPLCPDRMSEAELFFIAKLQGLILPEIVQSCFNSFDTGCRYDFIW